MKKLQIAIANFKKRAKTNNQKGSNLSFAEITEIQNIMEFELPQWYIDMMTNQSVVNIEFEIQEYENEDLKSSIEISNFKTIVDETTEAHPGLEIKPLGYINFGSCMGGSGDPIFINLTSKNPKVVRVYHDYGIENGQIPEKGQNILANDIGAFFDKASF